MSEAKQTPVNAGSGVSSTPLTSSSLPERSFGRGDRFERTNRGGNRRRDQRDHSDAGDSLVEKTVFINRSSKVVKGGRRFSFSALIVAGDKDGRVGIGLGKGAEVSEAIRKGGDNAWSELGKISLNKNTIPHEVISEYDGACILLRPASPGTGLICGKTVRAVVESAGVKDLLSKSLGSKNPANVAKATLLGLRSLRTRDQILQGRGLAK